MGQGQRKRPTPLVALFTKAVSSENEQSLFCLHVLLLFLFVCSLDCVPVGVKLRYVSCNNTFPPLNSWRLKQSLISQVTIFVFICGFYFSLGVYASHLWWGGEGVLWSFMGGGVPLGL